MFLRSQIFVKGNLLLAASLKAANSGSRRYENSGCLTGLMADEHYLTA